jgi:hypothetical protein
MKELRELRKELDAAVKPGHEPSKRSRLMLSRSWPIDASGWRRRTSGYGNESPSWRSKIYPRLLSPRAPRVPFRWTQSRSGDNARIANERRRRSASLAESRTRTSWLASPAGSIFCPKARVPSRYTARLQRFYCALTLGRPAQAYTSRRT